MNDGAAAVSRSPTVIVGLLRVADVLVVVLCAIAAYWVRHGWADIPGRYWLAIFGGALLTSQAFAVANLYRFEVLDRTTPQVTKLATAWAAVGFMLITLIFFTKTAEDFSRIWAGLWLSASFVLFLAVRVFLRFQIREWRRAGLLTRDVAVVGAGETGAMLLRHLDAQPGDVGIQVTGVYDDRASRVPTGALLGHPIRGSVDDLVEHCRRRPPDCIVLALPWSAEARLVAIMEKLREVPVDVQLCPEHIGFRMVEREVSHLAGIPMLSVFERPLAGWSYLLKVAEDRVLALLFLLAVSPVLLLIALAIRLDSPGPVLFRQHRYGFNNNLITVWKFRTMRVDDDAPEVPQAVRNDPRVTRVGAFLRRTSLDELPQFINVLQGSMSIVGPRPHAVSHNERFSTTINHYYARHRVKPGITGWAQIHGLRGETDTLDKMRRRVEYDLYYIDNWSLLLDLKIILLTLFVGFLHENAY